MIICIQQRELSKDPETTRIERREETAKVDSRN
jgi:hypothetical protein